MKRLYFFGLLFLMACQAELPEGQQQTTYKSIEGKTMGTYYRVSFQDTSSRDLKTAIDSVLVLLNKEVSTYDTSSVISRFNQADASLEVTNRQHFLNNFVTAQAVYKNTSGYFDPTVMPLVNFWGFGYTEKKPAAEVDQAIIDSLMQFVGMDKVEMINGQEIFLNKQLPGVQLDFSAIAKGYGVDLIGQLLKNTGIENYLVDIGGEVLANGKNPKSEDWVIGINEPKEGASLDAIQAKVQLSGKALATSGNYRNFYEVNGIKYSHTINPKTGLTERNSLLSASVFAPTCMLADAYATAFMTLGPEKAMELANKLPYIDAYFIIGSADGGYETKMTAGAAQLLVKN